MTTINTVRNLVLAVAIVFSGAVASQVVGGIVSTTGSADQVEVLFGEPSPNDLRELMRLLTDERVAIG